MIGVAFHEKIEGIHHRHVGHQIDGDFQFARFLRKHEACDVIAENILLPVDEVLVRLDVERVRKYRRTAVRRRTQPYLMRGQGDQTVVAVTRLVMQCYLDAQCSAAKIMRFMG